MQRKHPWAYACALTREISRESLDSRQSGLKEQLRSQLARPLGALAGRGCDFPHKGKICVWLDAGGTRGVRPFAGDLQNACAQNVGCARWSASTSRADTRQAPARRPRSERRALRIQVAGEHRDDNLDLSLTAIEHRARLTRDAMLGSDPRSPGETANGYKVRVPS